MLVERGENNMFNDKELFERLENEYKYHVELHCHTNPASRCSHIPAADVVRNYKALGYDALCLTNHYWPGGPSENETEEDFLDRYFNDYTVAKKVGDEIGINVIFAIEFRFSDAIDDYLTYGLDPDEARRLFPMSKGSFREFRETYKNDDYLMIQAHPCRKNMVRPALDKLDGIEILNLHPKHNSAVALAARLADEVGGIVIAGSDYHDPDMAGLGGIWTKENPKDTHDIVRILKSGEYLIDFCGYPMLPQKFKKYVFQPSHIDELYAK